ncbi:MAG: hypothetical protein PHE93_02630 [Clostridia bacterium]|nr:hypothetical protein [Clostridia bacterium]
MKKFDFKKLLILVLALALVFSLVACGGGGDTDEPIDPEEPVTLTASDYFTALWNASKGIGSTAIASTSDLNFEMGADIDLAIKTGTVTTLEYKLGLDIKAVYDRDNTGSDENVGRYSAATIQLVDRTKTTDGNLISLYYYLDEPTIVYAQIYDQSIKIQFNADNGDGTAANATVVSGLTDMLNETMSSENTFVNNKSIDDMIMQFTSSFGPDFDLDDVVGIVMNMMGVDMTELIDMVQGFISFEVADEDNASLLDVLNGLGKVAIGNIKKTANTTGYTWSATLNSVVKTLLSGYTDGLINDANTTIGLTFDTNTDGNDIENFAISLERKNITSNTTLNAKIAITSLSASATTATTSGTGSVFGMEKTDFKSDYQINLDAIVSLSDAMLKVTYDDGAGVDSYASIAALYSDSVSSIAALEGQEFAGVLRIEADGMVNLLKSDSSTGAYAQVYYKTNETSAVETLIVEANFDNTDGIGVAKIWMDNTNQYAEIARDYLLLNLVKSLHNSNEYTAVDPENPTRAELLAGSNGAAIASIIGALNTDADTYYIKGIELQTMLWDLCCVDDKESDSDNSYDNVFMELPASMYPWGVDFLAIAKTAVNVASQSSSNALGLSVNGIANTFLAQVVNSNNAITNFGIFKTNWALSNSGVTYGSFENLTDIYSWFYKGSQDVIVRMTDAGIIGAISLVQNTSGTYCYNDDGELVVYEAALGTRTRYNTVKSTDPADAALIGQGTWFYQNSSTLTKTETRKIWAAATNTWTYGNNLTVEKINTDPVTTEERTEIYESCIEFGLINALDGSSFIGGAIVDADNGAWLTNILAGEVAGSISYVTEDGITFNLSYTDVADNVASIQITASIDALNSAYVVSTGTNLSFDEAGADCVLDISSYMDQVRADYAEQIAG